MESEKVTVLCSDRGCKYNRGGGYYGVCHHPCAQDRIPYAGIDRYYQSSCNVREGNTTKDRIHHDPLPITEDEIELLKRTPLDI